MCVKPILLGGILLDHETLSIVCRVVGICSDFPTMIKNFGPFWPSSYSVKWTWKVSAFPTNEGTLECNGHERSVSCVKWSLLSHVRELHVSEAQGVSCINWPI